WALAEHGIFRSDDGCTSWRRQVSGLEATVYTVLEHPTRPGTILAGTSTGVEVSRDGGDTWGPLGSAEELREVHALALGEDGRTIYAGTDGRGVFVGDLGPEPGRIRRRLPQAPARAPVRSGP